MTLSKQSRSRLSYAQEQPQLANDNPLNGKVESLTNRFEQKRCYLHAKQLADAGTSEDERRHNDIAAFKAKRRKQSQGSGMVKNHKPYPELKPSPALSHKIKAQTHYQELAKERRTTQRINRIQTTTINKGDKMDNMQNQNANKQQQPQNTNEGSQSQGNKPETVIRDGSLKATVWRNESDKGPYYNTTLAKTYTDQQGNPRDTQNFSQSDLLRVAELGREAYGMINDLKRGQGIDQSQAQDREAFKQSRRSGGQDQQQTQSQSFRR